MISNSLLNEIERQKKYLSQLPNNFEYPLFNAKHAIESQRKSGYRTTAAASREIVDNSIEAGANKIHIIFDTMDNRKGRKIVNAIAFIDNGSGMIPEMARYALSWGGGTHFDEPEFIGKFGFGLPNASINQTRLVEVYSRTNDKENFSKVYLNIDDYSSNGLQTIKPPINEDLPIFVKNYIQRTKFDIEHGVVVVWINPDRLTYKTPAQLKQHLLDDFGVTYRYLLVKPDNKIEIIVEGVKVEPVDPLFLMPQGRYFVPEADGGSKLIDERAIPVLYFTDTENGEFHLEKVEDESQIDNKNRKVVGLGAIHYKIARFPLDFAIGTKTISEELTDAHRRFEIRKSRRGMSFVRSGREIETVDAFPRSARDIASGLGDWPLLQSYAYHWGIEVKFEPTLDEIFGITNDKQSVRPIEDFWRLLHQEEIDNLVRVENNWQTDQRHERKQAQAESKAQPSETPIPAENAAKDADIASSTRPTIPDRAKEEAREKLDEEVKEQAERTKKGTEEVLAALELEKKRRPYKIDFFDEEYGPFYIPEWSGPQIVIKINRKHPFFEAVYGNIINIEDGVKTKASIDLLLITLSKGELTASDQNLSLWYQIQREEHWSPYLKTAIKALENRLKGIEEEEGAIED